MTAVDVTARAEELARQLDDGTIYATSRPRTSNAAPEIAAVLRALVAEVKRPALTAAEVREVVSNAAHVVLWEAHVGRIGDSLVYGDAIAGRAAEQLAGRTLPSTSEHDPCAVDLAECRRLAGVARALADIRHASITDLARDMLLSTARQLEAAAEKVHRASGRGGRAISSGDP